MVETQESGDNIENNAGEWATSAHGSAHSALRLHMPSPHPADRTTPYLTPYNKLQRSILAILDILHLPLLLLLPLRCCLFLFFQLREIVEASFVYPPPYITQARVGCGPMGGLHSFVTIVSKETQRAAPSTDFRRAVHWLADRGNQYKAALGDMKAEVRGTTTVIVEDDSKRLAEEQEGEVEEEEKEAVTQAIA